MYVYSPKPQQPLQDVTQRHPKLSSLLLFVAYCYFFSLRHISYYSFSPAEIPFNESMINPFLEDNYALNHMLLVNN